MISTAPPPDSRSFPGTSNDDTRMVAGLVSRLVGGAEDAAPAIQRLTSLHNRSYRVDLGSEVLVVRLPGDPVDLDRDVEVQNAAAAAVLGLGAPVVFADPGAGILITRWIEPGTPLRLPVGRAELEQIGRILARLHAGPALGGRFDPLAHLVDRVGALCHQRPTSTAHAIALSCLRSVSATLPGLCRWLGIGSVHPVHGDPTPGNWLDAGSTLTLIDWEYSGMGDPMWDLAEFSVTASLIPAQEQVLWRAYEDTFLSGGATLPESMTTDGRDRLRLWKIVCDVVGCTWALTQAQKAPIPDGSGDLVRYAHQRAERAATALAGPVAEVSLRMLT